MSQDRYPNRGPTPPGTTPAHEPGADAALERQRAEGDYPPEPQPDPLERGEDLEEELGQATDRSGTDDDAAGAGENTGGGEVPPQQTVPDEVAERAAREVDPLTGTPDPGMQHQNPMRPASTSSDIQKERPPADDL